MTFLIKQSKNFLSKNKKKQIEEVLNTVSFPLYMAQSFKNSFEYPYLTHVILKRTEDRKDDNCSSIYADFFLDMLKSFCVKNKIKVNNVFRVAVNMTFNFGVKKSIVHEDHNFDHKQLIIYLNDCDQNSKTILLNNKNKVIKEITPEKYKGVVFDKCPHYMIYPKTGYRVIVVYTFD
jgi:hypothetical protein